MVKNDALGKGVVLKVQILTNRCKTTVIPLVIETDLPRVIRELRPDCNTHGRRDRLAIYVRDRWIAR